MVHIYQIKKQFRGYVYLKGPIPQPSYPRIKPLVGFLDVLKVTERGKQYLISRGKHAYTPAEFPNTSNVRYALARFEHIALPANEALVFLYTEPVPFVTQTTELSYGD